MAAVETVKPIPWWKDAWWAAWLGWTLDAFDFTVFLLIMVPIAKEFDVPLAAVAFVLTITLWMRLLGATAAGWLSDRMGRKTPLMISIGWYSVCNFIAGFSPSGSRLRCARRRAASAITRGRSSEGSCRWCSPTSRRPGTWASPFR